MTAMTRSAPPAAAAAAPPRRRRLSGDTVTRFGPVLVPYLMLVVMVLVYASVQTGVLSLRELNLDASAALTLILVATGQTIVITMGGIDLSVGGVVSLSTAIAATKLGSGGGQMWLWMLVIVAFGAGAGALNGLLVSRLRLQPFIVTLATWSVWGGVALWVLPTEGGTIPTSLTSAANGTLAGIATPVWLVVVIALFWAWFKRTRLGTGIRSVGSSERSARLGGVDVARTTVAAYALCGLFAALAGIFLTTQTASGSPTVGNDYILQSVAAVVIGGTSLFGGRGGVGGTIAGALILTIIGNLVFALHVSSFWVPIASGLLLVLAVVAGSAMELYARRQVSR